VRNSKIVVKVVVGLITDILDIKAGGRLEREGRHGERGTHAVNEV